MVDWFSVEWNSGSYDNVGLWIKAYRHTVERNIIKPLLQTNKAKKKMHTMQYGFWFNLITQS